MLVERIEHKWLSAFVRTFELCRVEGGQTAAILTETQSRRVLVDLARLALEQLGARVFEITLTSPPLRAPVPVRSTGASDAIGQLAPVVASLARSDFVVDCTVEGLLHAPELPAILQGSDGRRPRVLMISNEHPEILERTAPDAALETVVRAAMKRLKSSRQMTVTSAAGTALQISLDRAVIGGVWGFCDKPGMVSHWPGGLALAFPAAGSVQGRLVLAPGDVNLTFKRYVRDRISLTIEDDHVVAIEGQGLDADHERSRAGMAKDSERQRSRVSTETPTSRETSPTDAVFGGSSLASTLCLKDLPYRANLSSSIAPGLMKKAAGQAVDLWTMRCAHRPACRGQRWRVAHRTGLRPQAPQPPSTIIFKPAIVQNCWIYGSDNYSDAGGNPKANYAVLANANEKIRADCKSSTRQ